MILFIEPISRNIGMYVPAYPLPLLEIASFVKSNLPEVDVGIISIPTDYGLPLSNEGKNQIYRKLLEDISQVRPKGIGISCTAISQAEEVINLCNLIKTHYPSVFIFLGGYFPTIYYEEIFSRTSAVDLITIGEGEVPSLHIIELLEKGESPKNDDIPNLVWQKDGQLHTTRKGEQFNLRNKACLDLALLKHPRAYDIMPYAFSRGCPYKCNFCMEDYIRPIRKKVPAEIIQKDLPNLLRRSNTSTLMISDALFESFDLFPLLRSLGIQVNFETRCDVLKPSVLHEISDVCAALALGFESASYSTLRRMNKVSDRAHYEKYMSNTLAIFKEAARNEIPTMVFMIAGYPGDTVEDLKESLLFARELSQYSGAGGHVFKVGECHVYPKTKIYDLARALPDVVFDNDGVFGQNIVREPSRNLNFKTILYYVREIFNLSNLTPTLQKAILKVMPFFRMPAYALRDEMIPDKCFRDTDRNIFNVQAENLSIFKELVPKLTHKYKESMYGQREIRNLEL